MRAVHHTHKTGRINNAKANLHPFIAVNEVHVPRKGQSKPSCTANHPLLSPIKDVTLSGGSTRYCVMNNSAQTFSRGDRSRDCGKLLLAHFYLAICSLPLIGEDI